MAARVAVVTGANKNIGFFIARNLAQQLPKGSVVYVCARSKDQGEAAVQRIKELGPAAEPRFFQLEITEPEHVEALRQHLAKEHDGLDVLVNNAGFAFKGDATEPRPVQARETCRVNYDGTALVMRQLCPLMRSGGRVVNVGSMAGALGKWSDERKAQILSPTLTIQQLDGIRDEFMAACEKGVDDGFPPTTYGLSKALVHGLTRIYARDIGSVVKDPSDVCVNAVCPGWCKSDMAGWEKPPKTSEEGADTPTWAALLPPGAPTGKFFSDRQERGW
eukprot:TRINITY_DN44288_c0_g1_i1.p2 TRINITY_DN44288_c0_g1~~TRINITY_DN44288_c0_g1_i1.p2  ORF type:complete len:297 (+),score=114.22 TRINITY_DN44288_c0_g1_i1:65-892(+)